MKLSLNWIKEFTDVPLEPDALVEKIGAQLGAVDGVVDFGKKYIGAHVVKVVSCVKHPNADKLSVCLIDDGGFVDGVDRNRDGLVQVVCGAPNVKAGMMAVWLPPGMTVPVTADKDPFVLEAREIRGELSNGMLASPQELALGDSHEGILEIEDKVQPGMPFDEMYGLDDQIIDIENKMFTHRPDLFGQLGLAREVAGIQHKAFKSPAWYREDASLHNDGRKNVLKLTIKNDIPKLVPRFTAVVIKDVKVEESPVWLKAYLARTGVRPINNIVDITNYLMLETAQPLHAYDYDKVGSGVLGVRLAKANEKVVIIGGKSLSLNKDTIVITDGQDAIGLGGVMGGQSTEVGPETKNIILEVANFDMNATRRAAMAYGLFTDAATRFTKNQSPRQTGAILVHAVEQVRKVAGGRLASPVVDNRHISSKPLTVEAGVDFINSRLGLDLSPTEIKKLLENVEFKAGIKGAKLEVLAPFWRTDIEIAEDIVEEVGRLYGYDRLPLDLPKRSVKPSQANASFELKSKIRRILAEAGANEVLSYSFVHGSLLEKSGQDVKKSYHLKNALSPALQYYRQSLMPSLLAAVHPNVKNGYDKFAIFEIGRGRINKGDKKLPYEMELLALAFTDTAKSGSAAYFQARKFLDFINQQLNLDLSYETINQEIDFAIAQPYDQTRSALVKAGGDMLGIVGEFKSSVISGLKLPQRSAGFEIDLSVVGRHLTKPSYRPLNRYPETHQDITLRTPANLNYAQLEAQLKKTLNKQVEEKGFSYWLQPLGAFRPEGIKISTNFSWRISLAHPRRTLTTDEVNQIFDKLEAATKEKFKVERV